MKQKSKYLKQFLALLLVIAITATHIDMAAFAQEPEAPEPYVVRELEEARTENTTTYLMSDGTKKMEYYTSNIRYTDEDGKLQDYDSELVETDGSNYAYENASGDMMHYFPEVLQEETPVTMESDQYAISFSPILDNSVQDVVIDESKIEDNIYEAHSVAILGQEVDYIVENASVLDANEAYTRIVGNGFKDGVYEEHETKKQTVEDIYGESSKKTTDIIYKDEDAGVDIAYTSMEYGVKENIVIHERNGIYVYALQLNLTGLTPILHEEIGSISLVDNETGEQKASIAPPNMNDATGEAYSEDVYYTLEEEEEDSYILRVHISKAYLDSEDRAYPVTVDPSATWKGSSDLQEAYVIKSSAYSDTNFYDSGIDTCSVGKGSQGLFRTYFRILNLKPAVEGYYVESAQLTMYENGSSNADSVINLKRVTESFKLKEITWNAKPSHYAGKTYDSITSEGVVNTAHTFDITEYVQDIANGSLANNYGLMLASDDESASNTYVKFYGFRSSVTSKIPKLVVTYFDPPTQPTNVTLNKTQLKQGDTLTVSWEGITSRALSHVQYLVRKYNTSTEAYETFQEHTKLANNTTGSGSKKITAAAEWGPGQYRIYIRGVDEGGIAGTGMGKTFVIDGTNPVISSSTVTPTTGTDAYSNALPTVTWSVTDTYFSAIQYSLNGGSYTTLATTKTGSKVIEGLTSEAENTIRLRAIDKAGNYSSVKTHKYYYDAKAPNITSFTLNGMSGTITDATETEPVLAWQVSDRALQSVEYSLNGEAYVSLGNNASGTEILEDMNLNEVNSISLRATDASGNVSEPVLISYAFDSTLPQWSHIHVEAEDEASGQITLSAVEAEHGIDTNNVYYAVVPQGTEVTAYQTATGVQVQDGTLQFGFSLTGITEGIYDVYVKTSLVNGSAYGREMLRWYYFPDAEYDGENVLIGEMDKERTNLELAWSSVDESKAITSVVLYARYGDGMFEQVGTYGSDVNKTTIALSTINTTADFRVFGVYNDGNKLLSNFVTYTCMESEYDDEEGNLITQTFYMEDNIDNDEDKVCDVYETWDLQTDATKTDSDGDGFDDYYEVAILGTNPAVYTENTDSDNDGLTNLQEYEQGTYPYLSDTDFDGYNDSTDTEPLKTDETNASNANLDVQPHVGLYDREITETIDDITYTSITNRYTSQTKCVSGSDNRSSFYLYDVKGNKLVQIERAGAKRIANTYTYDEGGNVLYVYHNGFGYNYEYEYGVMESEESADGAESTIDYTDATLTGVSVGNQSLVSYATNVLTDNTETEDTLSAGAVVLQTEDVKTYGNGDTVRTVTTEYKLDEDVTESTLAEKVEVYRNDGSEVLYSTSYNLNGEVIQKQDASGTSYSYVYSDEGNTVTRTKKNSSGSTIYIETKEYIAVDEDDSDGITQSRDITTYSYTKDGTSYTKSSVSEIYNKNTDTASYTKITDTLLSGHQKVSSSVWGTGLNIQGNADESIREEVSIEQEIIKNADDEVILSTTKETDDTTTLTVTYQNDSEMVYTYDTYGNIVRILTSGFDANTDKIYTYDGFSQLTYEKIHFIEDESYRIYKYEYDNGGNITAYTAYECAESVLPADSELDTVLAASGQRVTYGYDSVWKDKLISYNGQSITYDAMGNPTNYLGNTLTWDGRTLMSYGDITYTYSEDGIRTSKTDADGNQVLYELNDDGQILFEKTIAPTGSSYTIKYLYDGTGNVVGFISDVLGNGEQTYYYGKNAQGDVIAIYDDGGTQLVAYEYDAWGNLLESSGNNLLAEVNPIRYRGYYYDMETELYYLQSRYYNPEVKRFLNSDDLRIISEYTVYELRWNVMAYCVNNPVNMTDDSGDIPRWITDRIEKAVKTGKKVSKAFYNIAKTALSSAGDYALKK